MTTHEDIAIERMAKAMDDWDREPAEQALLDCERALNALLSPSPCPTCGGKSTDQTDLAVARFNRDGHLTACPDCTDGTVPPLLRWNEPDPSAAVVSCSPRWDWRHVFRRNEEP